MSESTHVVIKITHFFPTSISQHVLLQPGLEPSISCTRSDHSNHGTKASHIWGYPCVMISQDQSEVRSIDCKKRNKVLLFFCFVLFLRVYYAHNFGTTGPIQEGFSSKCTSLNEHFNQIEN